MMTTRTRGMRLSRSFPGINRRWSKASQRSWRSRKDTLERWSWTPWLITTVTTFFAFEKVRLKGSLVGWWFPQQTCLPLARIWHVVSAHSMRTVCLVHSVYHDILTISNSCDDPSQKLNFRHKSSGFRSLLHVHAKAKWNMQKSPLWPAC